MHLLCTYCTLVTHLFYTYCVFVMCLLHTCYLLDVYLVKHTYSMLVDSLLLEFFINNIICVSKMLAHCAHIIF